MPGSRAGVLWGTRGGHCAVAGLAPATPHTSADSFKSFCNLGWGPLEVDPLLHETQGRVGLCPGFAGETVLCLLG